MMNPEFRKMITSGGGEEPGGWNVGETYSKLLFIVNIITLILGCDDFYIIKNN